MKMPIHSFTQHSPSDAFLADLDETGLTVFPAVLALPPALFLAFFESDALGGMVGGTDR